MNIKALLKALGAVIYKNRATIETVAGMVAVAVGTGVVISKARKATEVADELETMNQVIRIKDANNDWEDKKERSHEVRRMVKYAVVEYTKAYALGLGLEAVGFGLIVASDITMSNELTAATALAASYASTLSAVKDRVIADQGEEKWQEYLLGPQFTTVDVMPDGTVIQTTEPLDNPNASAGLPPHCMIFDEANYNWEKDPIANLNFLEGHLRWLNERLWREEFLFENDIRRDLGFPIVKSGWTSGIFAKDKDGNRVYLDIGLNAKNPAAQRFRDGIEPSIILQLNVEDNIIEQMRIPLI